MKKTKPYNWDTKLMTALRRIWAFSPERKDAMKLAEREKGFVQCANCKGVVDKRTASVDHIQPVVPLQGFDSWDAVIARMRENKVQVLCTECHKTKTKKENQARRAFRKLAKGKI